MPNQEQLSNARGGGSLSSACSGSPNQCNDNDGKRIIFLQHLFPSFFFFNIQILLHSIDEIYECAYYARRFYTSFMVILVWQVGCDDDVERKHSNDIFFYCDATDGVRWKKN